MKIDYPPSLEIQPFPRIPRAQVRVPGSKSITNRALVLAALTASEVPCTLNGVLQSEDTEVMARALVQLGYSLECDWDRETIRVLNPQPDRRVPANRADLFVANSGTTMRFLTALVGLGNGTYRLDGVSRMRERPIQDLLDALKPLGVKASSESDTGCPPVVLESAGLSGGRVAIQGNISSQFLSGLLMAAPFARGEVVIDVAGTLVSIPYVEMTLAMLRQFGLQVEHEQYRRFRVPGRQRGGRLEYAIEPDASAASYFFGLAAVTGGTIRVQGLPPNSLQGDVRFVEALGRMGCRVDVGPDGITVAGGVLRGIEIDMNAISDTVMTLAAAACFAEGPTTIRNVAHIRHKETDRIAALAQELRKVGAGVEEFEDGLRITPAPLHGADIETYNDHRMAMSLALVGVKVPGVILRNPACVAKTYPQFFKDLEAVR